MDPSIALRNENFPAIQRPAAATHLILPRRTLLRTESTCRCLSPLQEINLTTLSNPSLTHINPALQSKCHSTHPQLSNMCPAHSQGILCCSSPLQAPQPSVTPRYPSASSPFTQKRQPIHRPPSSPFEDEYDPATHPTHVCALEAPVLPHSRHQCNPSPPDPRIQHNPPSDVKNVPASHSAQTLVFVAPARPTRPFSNPTLCQINATLNPHNPAAHLILSNMSPPRKVCTHSSSSPLHTFPVSAILITNQ